MRRQILMGDVTRGHSHDVDEDRELQRAVGNAGVTSVMEVLDVVGSGGGALLDNNTRTDMESRLGHDFSNVRVHNDFRAHESARAANAHAYTVGPNIVFQRDKYDSTSTEGGTMLAHELTHVVQQRSRRWTAPLTPISPSTASGRTTSQLYGSGCEAGTSAQQLSVIGVGGLKR